MIVALEIKKGEKKKINTVGVLDFECKSDYCRMSLQY